MKTDRSSADHWNARYAGEGYLFGTEPDPFLVERIETLGRGRALSLGDGEGRHAVYLASVGFDVVSNDLSEVAVAKARRLAEARGVQVDARVGSIADVDWTPDAYDLVVLLFVHPPAPVRAAIHRGVAQALRPGGSYIVAAHHPDQVARGGRGPRDPAQAMTIDVLRAELDGLDVVHAFEGERTWARPGGVASTRHVTELHARRPLA